MHLLPRSGCALPRVRKRVARVAGLEPAAYRLGGGRSIHLSYTRSVTLQAV